MSNPPGRSDSSHHRSPALGGPIYNRSNDRATDDANRSCLDENSVFFILSMANSQFIISMLIDDVKNKTINYGVLLTSYYVIHTMFGSCSN